MHDKLFKEEIPTNFMAISEIVFLAKNDLRADLPDVSISRHAVCRTLTRVPFDGDTFCWSV